MLVLDDVFSNLSIEGSDCKDDLIKSAKVSSSIQLESLSEWDANKVHSLHFWKCQGFRSTKVRHDLSLCLEGKVETYLLKNRFLAHKS